MELRTRILPKMLNREVQEYLEHNDLIIVPVGTVEMHGGLPLDCETVISEAIGLEMAQAADGLVLTGLPYFYAGATASGRGTVQVSVRQGIDYLGAIARSRLRQGFKRQIYISMHGPAHMTCSPMVRDFFDETGVPILYMDMTCLLYTSWQRAFAQIREAAQDSFARMGEAARGLWDGALWPLLQSLGLEVVPGIVNGISQALASLAGGAGAGVLTALGAAFETLCGLFQNLYLSLIHI